MRRETLILVVVLAALLAVYLITQRPFGADGPQQPSGADLFFPGFVPADVTAMSAQGQGIDVTLLRTEGGWVVMTGGEQIGRADPEKVEQALEMIALLPKTELVSVVPEKHAVFEVVEGRATRLRASGGGRILADVLVGKRGPGFMSAYVRLPDGDEVYLSQRGFPSNVVRPVDHWRDREIASFDRDKVTELRIDGKDERIVLSYLGEEGWRMTEPSERPADEAAVLGALTALSSLSAAGFEDERSPADCGFDDPTAVVSVELVSDGGLSITIGGEDEGSYFVRRSDRPTIYRVPALRLERILVDADEFAAGDG